jgi:hypothetical protein
VSDINQGGFIVGGYGASKNALKRGFLRRPDGTIVPINIPGELHQQHYTRCLYQPGWE